MRLSRINKGRDIRFKKKEIYFLPTIFRIKILFLFLLLLIFLPGFLLSQELGHLNLAFRHQTTKTEEDGLKRFIIINSLSLNLWQNLLNWGSFSFSLDHSLFDGLEKMTFYRLDISDVPVFHFKLNAQFGNNIFHRTTSLPHFGAYNPSKFIDFKGFKISLETERYSFAFFSGKPYKPRQYWESFPQIGEANVYGFKTTIKDIKDRMTFGAGYIRGTNFSLNNGRDSLRVNSDIFSLDGSYRIDEQLYLLGDFNIAFSQGIQPSRFKSKDIALKIGPYYRSNKLSLQAFYRYTGADFPQLERGLVNDQAGFTAIAEFIPFRQLSFFASMDTIDENLLEIFEEPVYGFITSTAGVNFYFSKLPTVSTRISLSKRKGERQESTISDSTCQMYFVSLFKSYRQFHYSFNYNKGEYQDHLDASNNFLNSTISFNLTKQFERDYNKGVMININGAYSTWKYPIEEVEKKRSNFGLNGHIDVTSVLSFNGGFHIIDEEVKEVKRKGLEFNMGINYEIKRWKSNISAQYRHFKGEEFKEMPSLSQLNQFIIYWSKSFSWGRELAKRGIQNFREILKSKGAIRGDIFVDINEDNLRQFSEEGVAEIGIYLDRRKATVTDENGHFYIPALLEGEHEISLDLASIPAFYELPPDAKRKVKVKGKKTISVDFPIIPVESISGEVILDINENDIADEKEPKVPDVKIDLIQEEKVISSAITDTEGRFYFDNVRSGDYTITVDAKDVEKRFTLNDKSKIEITFDALEEMKGIVLLLRQYKKPIIIKKPVYKQ